MSEEINQAPTVGAAGTEVEEEQARPVVDGTPLECGWTFWFDKKNSKNLPSEYQENLKKIGTFYSIEEFWRCLPPWIRATQKRSDAPICAARFASRRHSPLSCAHS